MSDIREIVYEALLEGEKGNASPGVIGRNLMDKYAYLDKHDRSFMHCLYEGVIDKTITLDYVMDNVSKLPSAKMKKPVRCLLRMGAYQILFMNSVPDHAACGETVKLAKKKHLGNLSGFINGVLRSICRLEGNIAFPDAKIEPVKYLSVKYSVPVVVTSSLVSDYGTAKAEEILINTLPDRPVYAKTMTGRISTEKLLERLNAREGISARGLDGMEGFEFTKLDRLDIIPEFNEGLFTIQDISSQLAVIAAGIGKNDTVIDVCAAPGGKSANAADILSALDKENKGKVISCDVSEKKLDLLRENVARLGLDNVEVMLRDGAENMPPLDIKADVVLCDVPCSGLGIMARKRDIKYGISEEKFGDLVSIQRRIIRQSVKLLKEGGTFIYSTCTMRKDENDRQFEFIRDELGLTPVSFYEELPTAYKKESAKDGYLQLFTKEMGTDGFFISKFKSL